MQTRVLATVTGSPSHARAVLPFARALAAAGHEVVVACPEELAGVFDGLRVEAVMPPMSAAVAALGPRLAELEGPPEMAVVIPMLFAGPHVTEAVRLLRPVAERFGPDLVLRDGTELAGLLLAEERGIPHVAAPSGGGQQLRPDAVDGALRERSRELGLAVTGTALHRHGRLDCFPPAWSFAAEGVAPAWSYRQDDEVARGDVLPAWIGELPAGRPLILAAIGTALPMMASRDTGDGPRPGPPVDPPRALRTIVDGLAELDCEAVVATGGLAIAEGAPVPPHVHVLDWVPQPLLLSCADLLLTHGGYNSIRETVRHGTPMVVLPQFGDQEGNADRVAALGLGRRCAPEAGDVTAACAAVLHDAGVHAEIRRAQRAMLALPPVAVAADDLAALAQTHGCAA
ncbi:glycosyl transferase [Actinomycetospora sp. NBRC 106375]|uniref:glycosyltransferase n=1 Tax=Actinomycetospora sp. NBRC 106375 TaxID=3032207 RepID=UPI0024A313DA|nr:glycosyltransferase [Actinomycetospora sp. NBRC 106375]GLZ45365.1 glycosyl transferase [Actinomycetospora sp. NBRC 106375]